MSLKFDPAIFTGSDKRLRYDSMSEAHIALAFQGVSWTSEFSIPLMIIQTILGSWDRSSAAGRNIASKYYTIYDNINNNDINNI